MVYEKLQEFICNKMILLTVPRRVYRPDALVTGLVVRICILGNFIIHSNRAV